MSWSIMIIHRAGGAILTRILMVIDFSQLTKAAVSYATGLARKFKSTVLIVHVVDPLSEAAEGPEPSTLISSDVRRVRTEELRRIKSKISGAGIEAKAIYYEGSPTSRVLKRLAKQRRADLIVVGAKPDGVTPDSTALQLIGTSHCPVLTLGPAIQVAKDRRISFHNIVYVTDYSPQALPGAAYVFALADGVKAHISVCRLEEKDDNKHLQKDMTTVEPPLRISELAPQRIREWYHPASYSSAAHISSDVLALASKVNADLIVVDGHAVAAWMKNTEDKTLHDILERALCPVLTL